MKFLMITSFISGGISAMISGGYVFMGGKHLITFLILFVPFAILGVMLDNAFSKKG